jgi:hypothetical protein
MPQPAHDWRFQRVSQDKRMPQPHLGDDRSTQWFTVVEHIHDRDLAARACQCVLRLVKSNAARAAVDAYTDHQKAMPPDARAAQEALQAKGKQQHKRDPGMKVDLDLSNAEDWDLLTRYAPWSINVDLYDHTEALIANFHDCGHDVTPRLSAGHAARLSDDLGDHLHVETLKTLRDREGDH